MGLTNIRSGWDITGRIGSDGFAAIPEIGKLLQFDGTNCTQQELDQYVELFRFGQDGMWLKPDDNSKDNPDTGTKFKTVPVRIPDAAVEVPRIKVTQALRENWGSSRSLSDNPPQPEVAYLLVVQGSYGALMSKPLIKWSLKEAGTEMLFSAANGLNVVFAGAILKQNVKKLRNPDYSVVKVMTTGSPGILREEVEPLHLVKFEQEEKNVIGIIC